MQRNLYRLLTTFEKAAVWKNKYHKLLSSSNLTKSQRSFIEKLENLITPVLFIKNKGNLNEKLNIKALKEAAIALFGVSGAYYLIASINEEKHAEKTISSLNLSSASAPPSCSCSRVDDWCSYPTTCIGYNCIMTVDGCGWWWNEDCNGTCVDRTWH